MNGHALTDPGLRQRRALLRRSRHRGRRHTFHEPSVARFAAWHVISVISGPFTLLSAASAVGSLLLARRGDGRGSLDATGQTRASLPNSGTEDLIGRRHEALHGRPTPTSETETDRRA